MMLSNSDVAELTDWRRALHRFPEVSGDEAETAAVCAAPWPGLASATAPQTCRCAAPKILAVSGRTAPAPR